MCNLMIKKGQNDVAIKGLGLLYNGQVPKGQGDMSLYGSVYGGGSSAYGLKKPGPKKKEGTGMFKDMFSGLFGGGESGGGESGGGAGKGGGMAMGIVGAATDLLGSFGTTFAGLKTTQQDTKALLKQTERSRRGLI